MNADMQLQTRVLEELTWRPSVNSAHIGVAAKNGVITLSGQVDQYAEKTAAENAAKDVYGVMAVANDIVIEMPGPFGSAARSSPSGQILMPDTCSVLP